jgi:Subtilase family
MTEANQNAARGQQWGDRDWERERLRGHIGVIRRARADVAVSKGNSDDDADMDHMYREGVILVRDADLSRVSAVIPGDVEASLINGLTAYRPRFHDTAAALARLDRELGVGVATPDHVVHITGSAGACPATEPEIPKRDLPFPDVSTDPECDGTGALVSVVDTGYIAALADDDHPWLKGVKGDPEQYDPDNIGPYVGHGTFVTGVLRCMAPKAEVRVEGYLTHGGTIFESEIVTQLDEALDHVPDVISLSAGTTSRKNLNLLGFEVFWESRLRHYKGTVLVAAAGNDHHRGPFWPAAFPWAVSVGSLDAKGNRAAFSNYGSWVDVYALGVDIVNAFPNGTYTYREPPRTGKPAKFERGFAQWSGTSFSTPIVAGLIAARMSHTGESGRRAADALLEIARKNARPRVGPILNPGDGCAH